MTYTHFYELYFLEIFRRHEEKKKMTDNCTAKKNIADIVRFMESQVTPFYLQPTW